MHLLLIQRYLILHKANKAICGLCASDLAHRPLPTARDVTLAPLKIPARLSSCCGPHGLMLGIAVTHDMLSCHLRCCLK